MIRTKKSTGLLRRMLFRATLTLATLTCFWSISDAQPFGRRGFRGRGFGGRGGSNLALILSSLPEVHEELSLSQEQATMVAALQRDLMAQLRGRGRERAPNPEISDKLFASILNKNQAKRFHELRLQFGGLRAFDREEVRTALELTDEQLRQIRELRRNGPIEAPAKEQLEDVLSDKQQANWNALIGETFAFTERVQRLQQLMRRGERFRGSRPDSNRRGETEDDR